MRYVHDYVGNIKQRVDWINTLFCIFFVTKLIVVQWNRPKLRSRNWL